MKRTSQKTTRPISLVAEQHDEAAQNDGNKDDVHQLIPL